MFIVHKLNNSMYCLGNFPMQKSQLWIHFRYVNVLQDCNLVIYIYIVSLVFRLQEEKWLWMKYQNIGCPNSSSFINASSE